LENFSERLENADGAGADSGGGSRLDASGLSQQETSRMNQDQGNEDQGDADRGVTASNRLLYRAWAPTDIPDTAEQPPQRRRARGAGPWLAAAPMLAVLAMVIGSALILGATAKATTDLTHSKRIAIAGAEQMRRQAQAVQAFQAREYADAYGRFAALADEGDATSALMALTLVRHGPRVFGSQWSATAGQLQRWSTMALTDVQQHAPQIAQHDRGE
jgi:hypothetical protein